MIMGSLTPAEYAAALSKQAQVYVDGILFDPSEYTFNEHARPMVTFHRPLPVGSDVRVNFRSSRFPGSTVIAQNDGWRYGDMGVAHRGREQSQFMYIRRAAVNGWHRVIAMEGRWKFEEQVVEEDAMTYLPDPVPSSATAGGSR